MRVIKRGDDYPSYEAYYMRRGKKTSCLFRGKEQRPEELVNGPSDDEKDPNAC